MVVIWEIPRLLLARAKRSAQDGRRARPLFTAICALTFLIYPLLFYRGVLALWMPAMLLLTVRNLLLIALWMLMAVGTEAPVESRSLK